MTTNASAKLLAAIPRIRTLLDSVPTWEAEAEYQSLLALDPVHGVSRYGAAPARLDEIGSRRQNEVADLDREIRDLVTPHFHELNVIHPESVRDREGCLGSDLESVLQCRRRCRRCCRAAVVKLDAIVEALASNDETTPTPPIEPDDLDKWIPIAEAARRVPDTWVTGKGAVIDRHAIQRRTERKNDPLPSEGSHPARVRMRDVLPFFASENPRNRRK